MEHIFIIYYDGQPYDHVQNVGRGYGRARSPKRIYWTRGHAQSALRGIVGINTYNQTNFDPSLFEVREFELTPVTKEND